jgi:hypothetical protein
MTTQQVGGTTSRTGRGLVNEAATGRKRRRWPDRPDVPARSDVEAPPVPGGPFLAAMGDMTKALRAMVPVVVDVRTVVLDANGQAEADFRLPFRAVSVTSASASTLTLSPGPKTTAAPTSGPGVCVIPARSFQTFNCSGYTWSLYGGSPGDQVTVQAFGTPVPPAGGPGPLTSAFNAASLAASGAATSPGATTVIATLAAPPAGLYQVGARAYVSGTVAAADGDNVELMAGAAVLGVVLVPPLANSTFDDPMFVTWRSNGATALTLQTIGAGTAASVYHGSIIATQIGL